MARSSATSALPLNISAKHQQQIQYALNNVESRIYNWLHGPEYEHNWKHYKTSINEHININCNKTNPITHITIHSLNDPNNKKCKVWRATAYLPSITSTKAIQCYTEPKYHLQYDDLDTMKKLHQFTIPIDSENVAEYNINVAVTNPRLNGWISSRLSVNICCSKYSKKMNAYCCLGTFMKDTMLHELKHKLNITSEDIKHTISKNLNLYWSGKPVIMQIEEKGAIIPVELTKITYILQVDNGGWIPQWAVEMGLIDQHMIAIFKQITKWLDSTKCRLRNIDIVAEIEKESDKQIDETQEKLIIDNVERIAKELNGSASESKVSESEFGDLSADSNIVSFNRFIKSKSVGDWIDVSDEYEDDTDAPLLSMKAKHELYGNDNYDMKQRVMNHIVYNKVEDLEIESDDGGIEIVEMQHLVKDGVVVDDDDDLLSDGVYVEDAETLRKEAQRCACLIDKTQECLLM